MISGTRKWVVETCDAIAPLAFLAAAAAMFLPFAIVHFPDADPIRLSGFKLIFATAANVPEAHRVLVQKLLGTWRPTIIASSVFAIAGLLAIFIRFFGSEEKKKLFEKLEIGIGALGAVCMGVLVSDVLELDIRTQGHLSFMYGMAVVAGCYVTALAAAAAAFFLEFTNEGQYRVGTLVYNNRTLMHVFFWILWGDFFFTLFEAIIPSILPLQLKAIGCSPTSMALLAVTIPNIIIMAVTPIISFKSDRTRTRWGRRIPYMLVTTPVVVIFLVSFGYLQQISNWVGVHEAWFAAHGMGIGTATLVFIGVLIVGFYFFNDFVNSVYWYLFADVVPEEMMGRFMGLFRLVGAFAGVLFNTFVFKHALIHTEIIYTTAGIVYLVGFSLMCFRIKEGQYPPVQYDGKKPTIVGQVGTYFRECFTHPLYVSMFIFNMMWAVSNACGMFKIFFYLDTAGITMAEIGKVAGWTGIISLLLMYPTGVIVDYFKPLPTLVVATIFLIPITFAGYFIDSFGLYVAIGLIGLPLNAVWDATSMPMMVQILPKDRFGQFCSANALCRSLVRIFLPLVGAWFIASTSVDVVDLKPGEAIRAWCEGVKWKTAKVELQARTPLQMLEAEAAAAGTNAIVASTNLISVARLEGNLNLKAENKNFYALEPAGRTRDVVLPGGADKKWFFIANTAKDATALSVKLPQWQYVWFWQCGFMCLGLVTILIVYVYWRRSEREKAGAVPGNTGPTEKRT